MANDVFKKIEIIYGSELDFKKFSKPTDFLQFEIESNLNSKNIESNLIIPDENKDDIKIKL